MAGLADRGFARRAGPRVWPLYVGGFLGPYGSTMVTPMVHEVAAGLRGSVTAVAAAVTVYMVPFAVLLLVSGTLAERWGRRRTVRVSLVVFVLVSVLCAAAPSIEVFLVARALQGASNAFTTPLLVASIIDLVPAQRRGRALGWFAAMQAAGQGFSPLITGLSASWNWRLAFAFPTLVAIVLVLFPPDAAAAARRAEGAVPWRVLLNRRLGLAAALSFLSYLGAVGLTVLVVLRTQDDFGFGPVQRGLVSAAFGVAGVAAAGPLGRWAERTGPRSLGLVMNTLLAAGVLTAALAPDPLLVVAGVVAAGGAVTGIRTIVNELSATSAPANRGGAASLALSAQFFGGALAPVLWVPLYHADARWGFAAAASAPLAALLVLLTARTLRPR
ncbi:MFS transporter [Saccharopolyspora gloriosae]|uniref:MFS transporter n=1 Tax=Saccharopolyspora gloriosae TaxID=455344 RepID=UPI001FB78BD5|nr:MFS transporter [Saccharopolyspora gloriosae]